MDEVFVGTVDPHIAFKPGVVAATHWNVTKTSSQFILDHCELVLRLRDQHRARVDDCRAEIGLGHARTADTEPPIPREEVVLLFNGVRKPLILHVR